ncbi:MAG: ferritin [Bacteroidales bacterium]|nr:ferritin [Bacteroidales bacterium]RLD39121.1 MAG: ferritin [Bacteroidota bacterium]
MINTNVEVSLNKQINAEEHASRLYFAMAIWCERNGFAGSAKYLYTHAEEERMHMIKLVHYVNERGGNAITDSLLAPQNNWNNILDVFSEVLAHEEKVTGMINTMYEVCMQEKDYLTSNFLQWYIQEQVEEEAGARDILDKLKLAGNSQGGLFHFDKEMAALAAVALAKPAV